MGAPTTGSWSGRAPRYRNHRQQGFIAAERGLLPDLPLPSAQISVAVAYREMARRGSDDGSRLGHNALSWSLYWSGTGFSFWHNGEEKLLGSPKARRIGVYLDQHAGVLSFHRIANRQAHLIHRHHSHFSGPLLPGFRFGSAVGAAATICQLD